MKTKLCFRQLASLLALVLSIFLWSCSKEEPLKAPESDSPTNIMLKNAAIPQPDDMVCDLIAGQNINVGKVIYSHNGNILLVEYVTSGDWKLTEVHFYVGTKAEFEKTCMNKKAIQIGKFPYSVINLNSMTQSFEIQLTGSTPIGGYMVVAHAVVKKPGQVETAFANCTFDPPVISVKSILTDIASNGVNKWAASDGVRFTNTNIYDYCYWLTTNMYVKNDTYPLLSYWYPTFAKSPGEVIVTDDSENFIVTINTKFPKKLLHTYIYIGTMENLIGKYSYGGTCLDYEHFPFQIETPNGTETHTYSVHMPNISFQNAFGSNRWGWISYYNF